MSRRYNVIDMIVGVGMCAILFGALSFFLAANGTYQATSSSPWSSEQSSSLNPGMAWLQPALGYAIIDQAILENRADHGIARSASDWNRATLALQAFQSRPDGAFGDVMRQAVVVPAGHIAHVQDMMGRAIVNFTSRGVRAGLLSADTAFSGFNTNLILMTQARGQRVEDEFASTWQSTLGRHIVEAAQSYTHQNEAIQEQLGAAVVSLSRAQMESEELAARHQERLGSLIFAAARSNEGTRQTVPPTAIASNGEATAVLSTEPASWPEIPLGYLIVAGFMLATLFSLGLFLAAQSREEKELARARHDASRWVYRMAS